MRLIELIKIKFANKLFNLMPDGSIYWPDKKALILGDLHLEKSSFFANLGDFLPPYDSYETLSRLDNTLNMLNVLEIILLGDIFHDKEGLKRLNDKLYNHLELLCSKYKVIWIAGNHDGHLKPKNTKVYLNYKIDDINFVHKSNKNTVYELSGHYHPKATISFYKKKISKPCFLVGKSKIILPAYGVFTGGIDSGNEIFRDVLLGDYIAYLALKKKFIKINH